MSDVNSTDPTSASPDDGYEDELASASLLLAEDPDAALQRAERLLMRKRDARAYRVAAAAFRQLGRNEDAEAAELAGIKASTADDDLQRAALANAEGRAIEARDIALGFLRHSPDDLLAQTLAAEARMTTWELEAAEEMLRAILKRAPHFLRGLTLLASCLAKQARLQDAIAVIEEVIDRKPGNVPALTQLAELSAEANDFERAIAAQEKLVALEPTRPNRWVFLAQYYRIVGRTEDAKKAFRKALSLDPNHGSAWWGLTNYLPAELSADDLVAMRTALAQVEGTLPAGPLHLALGLVNDRAGNYAEAFRHFVEGKRMRLSAQPYDPDHVTADIDGIIRSSLTGAFAGRQAEGHPDSSPIFIIGMLRSGSTLVERILGCHSNIEASGELPIMPRLAARLLSRDGQVVPSADALQSVSGDELASFGEAYVERSRDYRRSAKPRFTDKRNLNWLRLGLICLALPNAKIIDVRRGALDCCWANFKMLFGEGQPAANDLRHIGRFYRDYVRLVDAIDEAAPGRILKMQYEDVVDDIEAKTREMLDFLGLDFEPGCIDFHLSKEAVATASSEQVRRPLNREGIGSAEPYRQWLGPLIEELGPLAD